MSEEVAKKKTGALAPYDYGEDAGAGYEGTTADDFAIPFLALLQKNSPQVEEGDAQVPGAKAGMLMNNVTNMLYPESVIFVPVFLQHLFVEWTPRDQGGGMVARHMPDDDIVRDAKEAAKAAGAKFGKLSTRYDGNQPAGNHLTETFYMFGLRLEDLDDDEPAESLVVGYSSTKIKVYKRLMSQLRAQPGKPPLFANRVRLGVVGQANVHGRFFNFTAEPAVKKEMLTRDGDKVMVPDVRASLLPPTSPILPAAKALRDMIDSGAARMAEEDAAGDDDSADSFAAGGEKKGGEAPF